MVLARTQESPQGFRSPIRPSVASQQRIFVFLVDKSKEAHRVWQVMSLGVTTEHPDQCLLS
jgi:hypothetical protein